MAGANKLGRYYMEAKSTGCCKSHLGKGLEERDVLRRRRKRAEIHGGQR